MIGLITRHVPFELTRLELCKPDNDTSSDSEFSGFSELSEGMYTCKLSLADDKMKNIETSDVSSFSDMSEQLEPSYDTVGVNP